MANDGNGKTTNKVISKTVYYIYARLQSPLCVSNGDGTITDQDVLRNYDGIPFISGASLAGAMRAYIEKDKNEKCLFGFGTEDGRMSSVFVSDFRFEGKVVTSIRDSVKLEEGKVAKTGAKFDMEVIETGAQGYFTMEVVQRERDNGEEFARSLKKIFQGFKLGEIRLGSKKTRGYGEIAITDIFSKRYDKENILDYKNAYIRDAFLSENLKAYGYESRKQEYLEGEGERKYLSLTVPLRLQGAISIRRYAAKKNEPDFEHVTVSGNTKEPIPVVPGTSFAGAIRSRSKELLEELGVALDEVELVLKEMFGNVSEGKTQKENESQGKDEIRGLDRVQGKGDAQEKDCSQGNAVDCDVKKDTWISPVVVGECMLQNSNLLTMVRNGISRFESGAKDGALFKEKAYVGGETTLRILVRKQTYRGWIDSDAMAGLLLLVMKDLARGYLAVGGQTSVGRGIFCMDGELEIDGETVTEEMEKKYFQKLCEYLGSPRGEDGRICKTPDEMSGNREGGEGRKNG